MFAFGYYLKASTVTCLWRASCKFLVGLIYNVHYIITRAFLRTSLGPFYAYSNAAICKIFKTRVDLSSDKAGKRYWKTTGKLFGNSATRFWSDYTDAAWRTTTLLHVLFEEVKYEHIVQETIFKLRSVIRFIWLSITSEYNDIYCH